MPFQRVHKFKQEEILSALENENYEYFIIGMTKDGGEIVKQCGICLSTVIRTKMENHIKSHFNVVICSGQNLIVMDDKSNSSETLKYKDII